MFPFRATVIYSIQPSRILCVLHRFACTDRQFVKNVTEKGWGKWYRLISMAFKDQVQTDYRLNSTFILTPVNRKQGRPVQMNFFHQRRFIFTERRSINSFSTIDKYVCTTYSNIYVRKHRQTDVRVFELACLY